MRLHVIDIKLIRKTVDRYAGEAYDYARKIGERYPQGEPIILQSPRYSFFYAKCVIRGRWPEAEVIIAQNPQWAYLYAQDVIKGCWPEVEAVIATDARYAYFYACNIIKGRWRKAEQKILQSGYAAWYIERFMVMPKLDWTVVGF